MEYTYRNLFQYFKRFVRPYWGKFTFGSALRFISATVGLYLAYAFAQVVTFVTAYQAGDSLAPLYQTLILWVLAYLVRNLLVYQSKMLCIVVGQRASLDVERGALDHLSRLDIAWHQKENAGNKVKRIQRGADGVLTLSRVWVVNIVDIIVNFVGAFIVISHFDTVLAVLMLAYQVIYYVIASAMRRKTVIAARKKNIKEEESSGLMFEIMNNIRSVKVLGMTVPLLEQVRSLNVELASLLKENIFWYHAGMLLRNTWQSVARIALILFVIIGIIDGRYEIGFLILFYGYFNTLSTSVNDLSTAAQDIALAKTNIGRLAEFFDEPLTIESEDGKVDFPKDWDAIHIRDLTFGYSQNAVLSNISFDIKRGEKIGIVGLSGAGKTTLFKLLLKEHESPVDDILVGDIPLRTIKKSQYVRHVAAVLQETEVFNMSLRRNVTITNGDTQNDDTAFKKAMTVSHVDDFLGKLPDGAETLIGEKGVKLSGGEKQRLGIARAVFKNPEILFLDEATSHLDVESEQKIQDSLKHFFKDVTAVVIAHRLSTIKEMDRIMVMQDGKIIETGTFDELYAKDGRFREFWDKQQA
ncbi:MAG: ABC transporter ATP-binding protein [Candidatus Pacebacteria bacterium]|nr:ABC transporter ATP-binding protein [Candidatus Paceibacterota bacterium]